MTRKVKMKQLFKHPLFISGFSFLLLLFLASVIHSIFFNGVVPETKYLYEDGLIVKRGPFSPVEVPPLGTSPSGKSLMHMLLQGAKYTVGIAVVVAASRIFVASIIGLFFGNFLSRFKQFTSGIINAFYYIPVALICFVILNHVIVIGPFDDDSYTFLQKVVFELVILIIIAVPGMSLLIGNQVDQIYKHEFITAAKVLGGRSWHILRKHALPHMWPRLLIQFTQEIVQVLVLLIHLGFFHILFGGTVHMQYDDDIDIFISLSSEWSGTVGNAMLSMDSWPWFFFGPMVAFTLVILSFNFMVKGMEDVFFSFHMKRKKANKKQSESTLSGNKKFVFIQRENKQSEPY